VSRKIPDSTVRRLGLYLHTLEELSRGGDETVSSEELAGRAGTTAAQVRKDLSHFGSFGKRGLGYGVRELSRELQEILGVDRSWRVALVGAGRIGSALFEYDGFEARGFDIVTIVDSDPAKVGQRWGDVEIRDLRDLESVVREEAIDIAILAVPVDAVQDVLECVTSAGVRGILNFAPAQLRVPEGVALKDVNLVLELEALSFSLTYGPPDR
jgi:redox-sensing transcriptional repressor